MSGVRPLIIASAALLLLGGRVLPACAQDTPAAAPAAPAVDSNQMYVGDWDWSAQLRDSTIQGVFRINYTNGAFTGIVARQGMPPAPIRSLTVRNHFRDIALSVDFNGEPFNFTGHLDNPHNISGTLSIRGGIGRLRVQKRS